MKGSEMLDNTEHIDADLIEAADKKPVRKSNPWAKWGAIAACLCIAAVSAFSLFGGKNALTRTHKVQKWSAGISAKDYFKYNSSSKKGSDTSSDKSLAGTPYTNGRSFSDDRKALETDHVIPQILDHPLFDCSVYYNIDNSIYSIAFSWHRRGNIADYSDLTITAGYQEVEMLSDCIYVKLDENGNVVKPAITVTERDGVQIVAEGSKNHKKTLTFQNASGWYQIEGSWNDSYDDMVMLLDWIWEHPIDFSRFPLEAGDNFTSSTLSDHPDAFAAYIPDFTSLGYASVGGENGTLLLKNWEYYYFEGIYEASNLPTIWWSIKTGPDYYDQQEIIGDLSSLTLQGITDALKDEGHISFTWDDLCIRVDTNWDGSAENIWRIIQTLK